VYSVNETYKNNENWFPEAFKNLSVMGENLNYTPLAYNRESLAAYPFKSRSMLIAKRAVHFALNGTIFYNNYVVDDVGKDGLYLR